jgi:hypothetical protein
MLVQEDGRRLHREQLGLKDERKAHRTRINALLVTQGVDSQKGVRFFAVAELEAADAESVQARVRRRILRAFVCGAIADKDDRKEMQWWSHGGAFSLDATVCIAASDRRRTTARARRPPPDLTSAQAPSRRAHSIYPVAPGAHPTPRGAGAATANAPPRLSQHGPSRPWRKVSGYGYPSPDVLSGRSPRCACPLGNRSCLTPMRPCASP